MSESIQEPYKFSANIAQTEDEPMWSYRFDSKSAEIVNRTCA